MRHIRTSKIFSKFRALRSSVWEPLSRSVPREHVASCIIIYDRNILSSKVDVPIAEQMGLVGIPYLPWGGHTGR